MLTEKQRMIQKKIALYQTIGNQIKEKKLLQNALIRYPHWDFAVQRLQEIEMSSRAAGEVIQSGSLHYIRDDTPSTKEEILKLSYQYQKEWRFERDKQLMEQALVRFPDWDYVHKRLEWHSRPIFHRDPEKSKTQPRKPLHLPRDPNFIPKQETLDSLCFVTGTSSNAPYFELAVQLIESIKATRWYNNIPIKVLDCGLTEDDANYLRERFGCEVKDPGWSIDPSTIQTNSLSTDIPLNGWRGIVERPYIHKHFPGYEYYFWLDADMWVQNENAIDQFIYLCEKQSLGAAREGYDHAIWSTSHIYKNMFGISIPYEYLLKIENKKAFIANAYCIHKNLCDLFIQECENVLKLQKYKWGFDLAMLNYTFYKFFPDGIIFEDRWLNDVDKRAFGIYLNANKNLMLNIPPHQYLGLIGLEEAGAKTFPYQMIFSNNHQTHQKDILDSYNLTEEEIHQLCIENGWQQGNYFYRIYPNPEDLYGNL